MESKKNQSWIVVKVVKQILFRTITIGDRRLHFQIQRVGTWEFIAEMQERGQGWKIAKRKYQG